MLTLKKTALAVTAGLAAFTVGGVQASVLATSMIDMTNFVIKDAAGNIVTNTQQITLSNFSSNADQDVTLGGSTLSNSNPGSVTAIDFAPICVGDCPAIASNTFPVLTGPATSNYAAADQLESGAPIIGVPGFPQVGAHVANGSYVGLDDLVSSGSANSNNGLNVQYFFTANAAGALTFEFDARAYMEAFVSGDEAQVLGTFADTSYAFGFRITDTGSGATLFNWRPDGTAGTIGTGIELLDPFSLNENCSAQPTGVDFKNTCGTHLFGTASSGLFRATTLALTPGRRYQLSAFINTNVNAARVPEPSALALMGIGLLGIGAARIRRRYA